jgi:MFS family permease
VAKIDMVRANAYLTIPAFVAPVLGPPIGGFFTTYFTWRWIFFINVPIGILGLVLTTIVFKNERADAARPFDVVGFGLTGLAMAALMYALEMLARGAVGPSAALLAAVGLGAGMLAVMRLRSHPHPMIDLSILRAPTFGLLTWGGMIFKASLMAAVFLLPLLLQVGFGYTAFESGMTTLFTAVGSLTSKATARFFLRWLGYRRLMIGNAALVALTLAVCGLFQASTPVVLVAALLMANGIARSLQFTCLNTLAYADVPPRQMSAATSLTEMLQPLSFGAGVALSAGLAQLFLALRSDPTAALAVVDMQHAFFVMGAVSAASLLFLVRLPANAGAELAGRSG